MCDKEKLFLDSIDGFNWKYDDNEYPNFLFGFKDGVCLFEIFCTNSNKFNKKNFIVKYRLGLKIELCGYDFYINNEKIWRCFKSKFDITDIETKACLSQIINKHFKLNIYVKDLSYFNNEENKHIEKHFNRRQHV